MAEVALQDVDKVYPNGFHAVKDLSLEIPDGEFLVLVGPSGCGKTTALRMVAGLETISDGTISIDGRVVNDDDARRSGTWRWSSRTTRSTRTSRSPTTSRSACACGRRRGTWSRSARRGRRACSTSRRTSNAVRSSSPAASASASRWAARSCASRRCSSWTSRSRTSTRSSASRCAARSRSSSTTSATTTIYVTHDQVEAMTMGDRVAVMNLGVAPAGRRAAVALRRAREPVRRGIHRHAADEHPRRGRRGRRRRVTVSLGGQALAVPDRTLERYRGLASYNGRTVADGDPQRGPPPGRRTPRPATAHGPARARRGARLRDRRVLPHRRAHDPAAVPARPATRSRRSWARKASRRRGPNLVATFPPRLGAASRRGRRRSASTSTTPTSSTRTPEQRCGESARPAPAEAEPGRGGSPAEPAAGAAGSAVRMPQYSAVACEAWHSRGGRAVPPLPARSTARHRHLERQLAALAAPPTRSALASQRIYFVLTDRYANGDDGERPRRPHGEPHGRPASTRPTSAGSTAATSPGYAADVRRRGGRPRAHQGARVHGDLDHAAVRPEGRPGRQRRLPRVLDHATSRRPTRTSAPRPSSRRWSTCAHQLGLKVILDVVVNHTAT